MGDGYESYESDYSYDSNASDYASWKGFTCSHCKNKVVYNAASNKYVLDGRSPFYEKQVIVCGPYKSMYDSFQEKPIPEYFPDPENTKLGIFNDSQFLESLNKAHVFTGAFNMDYGYMLYDLPNGKTCFIPTNDGYDDQLRESLWHTFKCLFNSEVHVVMCKTLCEVCFPKTAEICNIPAEIAAPIVKLAKKNEAILVMKKEMQEAKCRIANIGNRMKSRMKHMKEQLRHARSALTSANRRMKKLVANNLC